ncbi:hypothetical protein CF64_44055 [Bradyrhizobium japonicum]|nr:hypothetical protein CF64_44055 [Bradyrhizobium japonicum]
MVAWISPAGSRPPEPPPPPPRMVEQRLDGLVQIVERLKPTFEKVVQFEPQHLVIPIGASKASKRRDQARSSRQYPRVYQQQRDSSQRWKQK